MFYSLFCSEKNIGLLDLQTDAFRSYLHFTFCTSLFGNVVVVMFASLKKASKTRSVRKSIQL